MFFGEIVEPSTRALIEDDYIDYLESSRPGVIWEIAFQETPVTIDQLIFVEGSKIIKLIQAIILNLEFLCSSKNGGIKMYRIGGENYLVLYEAKDITTGEVIEELESWINKAKIIYGITSEPISAYQNLNIKDRPETLIRVVAGNKPSLVKYTKLESPNLVSGLGADILTYRIHKKLESILFVIYMDNSPLDSLNTSPIVALLNNLKLPLKSMLNNINPIASNLYL